MAPKKFVPRQRKHKVIAREKAAREQAVAAASGGTDRDLEPQDSNALEIAPSTASERAERKALMKLELKAPGIKVSGKKAKRLEKYIDNKLKKDETRELLAKLAESQIDTSLFSSTRALGQTKETKREALRRQLRERNAGLLPDELTAEEEKDTDEDDSAEEAGPIPTPIFSQAIDKTSRKKSKRKSSKAQDISDASEPEDGPDDAPMAEKIVTESDTAPLQPLVISMGSGLKRPLETDDTGRPVIQKRQRRGGVKSKFSIQPKVDMVVHAQSESDDWDGFDSDEDKGSSASETEAQPGQDEDGDSTGDESGEKEESSSEEEDSSEEEGEEEEEEKGDEETPRRPSAFKAWAHRQRNEALGYQSMADSPTLEEIPRPANFEPRPIEQEPLPRELQPTANVGRKVYSVTVNRTLEIESARLALPVVAEEQKIMEAIHNNDIVVISGATGSGKTTQVPQFLFEAGYGSPGSPTPGMIGITQPRRVAAVSMSKRVAQELGDHSHAVAYQIRFEGTTDQKTAIKFMTDGVLLREVGRDVALRRYSAIIIDEAHERSVNTDVLVGILSRVNKIRKELTDNGDTIRPLKLIIMSATLRLEDVTQNTRLFSIPPPVLDVEGRQFPVTVHFARRTQHDYVEEAFQKISRGHKKLPPGGILVFLTGQNEIHELSKRLKLAFNGVTSGSGPKVRISASEAPFEAEDVDFGDIHDREDFNEDASDEEGQEDEENEFVIEDEEPGTGPLRMNVLPLYSLLPTKEQQRVFDPPPEGTRQVILATNVAETSLTIPGMRYVFDCGRSKERRYDRVSGVQSFEVGWISKASAKQRSGRAGRTGPGHCWRLYSSAVYERDFPEFAEPELLRMPVEGVVLQLKAMNIPDVVTFPFPTPPNRSSLVKAEKLLKYLSAISTEGQISKVGTTMSIFPLAPRFAKILLLGSQGDCMPYVIAMVAGLSAADVFVPLNHAVPALATKEEGEYRTEEDVQAETRQKAIRSAYGAAHRAFCSLDGKSDAIKLLKVVGEYAHDPTEEWCEKHFVSFKGLKEIQQLRYQIATLLKTNIPAFANMRFEDKLPPPDSHQIKLLKQMVAAGFVDQVAIRADLSPYPPEQHRKPGRAIDVPYLPLLPLEGDAVTDDADRLVYIHPSSPLAHLSVGECPEYVVYAYLQRAAPSLEEGAKKPKTRMHALTDVTGAQLAALAKGTPLIGYGKPTKEIMGKGEDYGKVRECWVVPYLRAEGLGGGMGWPLPMAKVKQRKVPGKGWVVE